MQRPPTALVTNDDGIDSPGLHHLAQAALDAGLEVVIAAPATEASGSSASITVAEHDGRILYERREIAGLPGVAAYAVEAGPGLIALLAAHGTFGPVPDLAVSGINRGINIGQVILHSGTVGAALTAGVNGLRALAVSQDVPADAGEGEVPADAGEGEMRADAGEDEVPADAGDGAPEGAGEATGEPDWTAAATLAREIIPHLADQPGGTVLNLNVPIVDGGAIPELRTATLAEFGVAQTTVTEKDEGADDYVRLAVTSPPTRPRPGSDAALLAGGYATITALRSVGEDPTLPLDDLVSRIRPAR